MHIEHPCIPFSTPVCGFHHDSKVHIKGDSYGGSCNEFCVEFYAGPDIALHISFHFGHDHHIRINSMQGGMWQCEERHCNPLCHGEHFELKIKNHHTHFDIKVNGHHVCDFHHRIPPHCITNINIRGDVHIHKIHLEDFPHHGSGYVGGYGQPYYPSPIGYGAPAPVVVIEEGHHHHHHGILHDLFHHHGHHHHHHHC